jgi:hypothetical protein
MNMESYTSFLESYTPQKNILITWFFSTSIFKKNHQFQGTRTHNSSDSNFEFFLKIIMSIIPSSVDLINSFNFIKNHDTISTTLETEIKTNPTVLLLLFFNLLINEHVTKTNCFPTYWHKQNSHLSDQTNRTMELYSCRSRHPCFHPIVNRWGRSVPSRTYSSQYVPFNRNSISEKFAVFLVDGINWRKVPEPKTEP